ncbi:MAG: hypothetical protein J7578_23550 [Chitinophagaceae bacterium]|nr:hypothetical protein [Chitinophagaceae bacterium]
MSGKIQFIITVSLFSLFGSFSSCKKGDAGTEALPEKVTPFPTAIGEPVGEPQIQVIGAAGGTITSPDGRVSLAIPAGALNANTTIKIQSIENTTPQGIGLSYDFLPNGQQFAKPVTVTLHYNEEEMGGTAPELLGLGFQNNQNVWQGIGKMQVNKAARTVAATINHFSRWSFYATFKMLPGLKTVLVNQTVPLQVVKLPYSEDPDPNNMDELLHTLGEPQVVAVDRVSNWQVNGQPSQDGNVNGWLTGAAANEKVYHAPGNIPAGNPVAVSADLNTGKGVIKLISNITVQKESLFEFTCDGQRYGDLYGTVTASASAGTFMLFMMATDVTGDNVPSLVLAMDQGFKGKGVYAFGEHNLAACTVTTYPYEWKTEYYEEGSVMPRFGNGTVSITAWGNIGELVTGTVSGTLHFQKTVGNITEHKTAPLNAKFSYIRTE